MDEGIPVCAENEDKNNWRRELGFQTLHGTPNTVLIFHIESTASSYKT